MLLLLGWYNFSVEKIQDSDAFYECVTDGPTNQPTNQPTDTAYYRDARTHLKNYTEKQSQKRQIVSNTRALP